MFLLAGGDRWGWQSGHGCLCTNVWMGVFHELPKGTVDDEEDDVVLTSSTDSDAPRVPGTCSLIPPAEADYSHSNADYKLHFKTDYDYLE